jgi:hypothetical protein
VAEGLDAHALEEHGAERRSKYEPSRRREMGAQARGHDGRKVDVAQERESNRNESDWSERKKMRGMGSTPPRLTLFIEGSTESICCGSLLCTTRPNESIPRSPREDLGEFFAEHTKCYDLNLSLGRQQNKKITSGRPDGKHNLQALTSSKIRSLANHFAKSTKYMTEEREHYRLMIQVVYDLIGSRIQGYIADYELIGSRTRGYKPLTTLLDLGSEGTQFACDLIGSRTRHTR